MSELDVQIEAAAFEYSRKAKGVAVTNRTDFKAGAEKMRELMLKENAALKETIRQYEHETETIKELKEINAQLKAKLETARKALEHYAELDPRNYIAQDALKEIGE
jgi:cell shape-determining protein MreC